MQAVATTAGGKTVLAPPYNVLITGSTKGMHPSIHSGFMGDHLQLLLCWHASAGDTHQHMLHLNHVSNVGPILSVQELEGLWQRTSWKLVTM